MTIEKLKQQLEEAYTVRNLNSISLTLINLYKEQQFSILQKIGEIIGDFVDIEISSEGKGFSKLIMLYHPDKSEYYLKEINRLSGENDFDGLIEHSHILKLEHIEEIADSLNSYEDIDYSPVYEWDVEEEEFTVFDDNGHIENFKTRPGGYDFYNAMKKRQYGRIDVEFPTYYLEEMDEIELSFSDITDLDGIQYCIHARMVDLSDNRIIDLSPLIGLKQIEELNLSDNRIEIIDDLNRLPKLKRLYLSNNLIEDISPLFEMAGLDYVDLTGNRISQDQISQLIDGGVDVDY